MLGLMYSRCQGVPQDDAQALTCFRQAAAQGHATAQANLGLMYANGRGVPQDDAQALTWFRQAAAQGHATAQAMFRAHVRQWPGTRRGPNQSRVMYANGRGVPQDDCPSLTWFRQAAAQGHATAKSSSETCTNMARACPRYDDEAQALTWFRKAADQGHAQAQFNLGIMYANGQGVPQDAAQAVSWYLPGGPTRDYAEAQFKLGIMYANGRGACPRMRPKP